MQIAPYAVGIGAVIESVGIDKDSGKDTAKHNIKLLRA